jgi:hypothetical protein
VKILIPLKGVLNRVPVKHPRKMGINGHGTVYPSREYGTESPDGG